MPASRRTTPGRTVVRVLVGPAVAAVLAGCTGDTTPPESPSPTTGLPLSAYDADGPALAPRGPCSAVPAARVTDALGEEVESSLTWAPGQRLPGTGEVADEYGCRHTAGDVTASAWVFAAPTDRRLARRLVAEVTRGPCRADRAADSFGTPGVAYTCDPDGGATVTGVRGLVGRTWVACEIRGTDDAERVDRWCAAVLESLAS